MLPEFPKAKQRTLEIWIAAITAGMRSDPLLAGIPIRVQKEGQRAQIDGSEMNYVPASVTHKMETAVGAGQSVAEFFDSADALGKRMAEGQARHLFKVMETPSPASQPFDLSADATFSDILEIWEKMPISFKDGKPDWPTIFVNEAGRKQIAGLIDEALRDPEMRRQWQALVERKRKEHDERETRRRLVD